MVVNGHEHVRSGWERGHVGPPRIQLLAVRCGKDPTHDDMGDSGYCAPSPLGPFFFFFWTQRRKPSREVWARSLSTSCDSRSTKMRVPCDSGCVTQVAGCTAQQRGYSPLARSSYFFFSLLWLFFQIMVVVQIRWTCRGSRALRSTPFTTHSKRGVVICALQPRPFGQVTPLYLVAGVRRLRAFCVRFRFPSLPLLI